MKKVAIIYKSLPQYRRTFFELLRNNLAAQGIELLLIYGQPGVNDATKKDTVDIPWAVKITNRFFYLFSKELYWQPCLHLVKDADLVIAEQASKLLVNYVFQLRYLLTGRKFAFWGHGKNFQINAANPLSETIKRAISGKVHWWFAYNDTSKAVVRSLGFPDERITTVQNAIDTRSLVSCLAQLEISLLRKVKEELQIESENVCLFASGMYKEKRLDFLLNACALIRARVADFEMIFIGAGPDSQIVKEAAERHKWIHYVGPKFDDAKVPYFAISKLFLMPGLVGLGILDCFALEVPMITTNVSYHSPEIEYLEDGKNGVIVDDADDVAAYASRVVHLLENESHRQELIAGCRLAREEYTVENMVTRFAAGVVKSLEAR